MAAPWFGVAPPASATVDVAVGVCTLELDVSGAYALLPATAVPPAPGTTLTITGGGMCVVNGQLNVTMTVTGSVESPVDITTWTCVGGVATGQLRFEASPTKFAIDALATTTVIAAGGEVSLSAAREDLTFVATGQFTQDADSLTQCPLNGSTTATWCGVLEFVANNDVLPPTSGRETAP